MQLMSCRFENLQKTYQALQETGIYLLGKIQNTYCSLNQMSADDCGIYVILPWMMQFLNISLQQSIDCFFYGILTFSFCAALCFCFAMGSAAITSWALVSFLLLFREGFFRLTDVYSVVIAYNFLVMPFFLWFIRQKRKEGIWIITLFFLGIFSGYTHYIRLYGSLGGIFFILGYIVTHHKNFFYPLFFVCGLLTTCFHMHCLKMKSSQFLARNNITNNIPYQHVFWHNIYAGLGYIENYLDITYSDASSYNFAKKKNAHVQYCSYDYERILAKECIRIFTKERLLAGTLIFAKLGVVLFFILVCANVGLWCAYKHPKGWLEYLFWIGAFLQALPGILVIPRASYLSGLTSWMFIYGIYSIIVYFWHKK